MPGRFLSDMDRNRLSQFPLEISSEDLITYFTLSSTDLVLLENRRGDHNKLGMALQLGLAGANAQKVAVKKPIKLLGA